MPVDRQMPCPGCAARLEFDPEASALACPYCGRAVEIALEETRVAELDFEAHLQKAEADASEVETRTVRCASCGGETTRSIEVVAEACPFCGTSAVVEGGSSRRIKPGAVLPFGVPREKAEEAFRSWIKGRWFAPSALKALARREGALTGVYVPHWTFDCETTSAYKGLRGDDYWETVSVTEMDKGRPVRRARRVRKTRWWPASGTVHGVFDDVLVLAGESLPRGYVERLEPWDLDAVVPYRDDYLAGFRAETYRLDLRAGFEAARKIMAGAIDGLVRRDIGGDRQHVLSIETRYGRVTFKHVLLPVWVSAYRFKDRVFRILVNARTGEVQGERPWSVWKIVLAVAAAIAAAGIAAALIAASR